MNSVSGSQNATKPRHYIIVVHGIGEQKINETTTPVVHRFAEERQGKEKGHYKTLLPSYLSAQSIQQEGQGHGWSEFKGIPVDKNNDTGNFDGTPATDTSGQNFRFVDLSWQYILNRHEEFYASPVDQWAPALLARLTDENMTPKDWPSPWALPLLNSLVKVILPIQSILGFKNPELAKKIFSDILGDVHLYGDYSRTRGRAVRHFHVMLDEIMLRDFIDWFYRDRDRIDRENKKNNKVEPSPYQPPEFTILAHSLGTIMSFDALVYANASQIVREGEGAAWNVCPSLPFLGYTGLSEADPQREAETTSWEYLLGELNEPEIKNHLYTYAGNFPNGIDRVCIKMVIDRENKKNNKVEPSPYQPPEFTILAHSLGTIMSFDALVYANASQIVREGEGAAWNVCPSLPFLGYTGLSEADPQREAETTSWEYLLGELNEPEIKNHLYTYAGNFPNGIDRILDQTSAPKIPLLNWRGQIKNFITLGSPIDKYHVLWWQKYLHMGLKRNDSYPNPDWEKGVDGWLNHPIQKIKHYNFCDEQDPVGHHLDVARGTVNYREIFDSDPVSERDIVFRRYAKPGVAHVMYWEDKDLFGGLINHIIKPTKNADPKFFLQDKFRKGEKAFKQALLWAYFRVPFVTAFLTGLLVIYAAFGGVPIYRLAAGLAVIWLWIQTNFSQGYKDEANPENFDKEGPGQKIKTGILGRVRLQRGIFARLVAGMVEWRRVVLKLRQDDYPTKANLTQRVPLDKDDPWGWSFWWRWGLRVIVTLGGLCWFTKNLVSEVSSKKGSSFWNSLQVAFQNQAEMSFDHIFVILFSTYLLIMLYVAVQFVKAKM